MIRWPQRRPDGAAALLLAAGWLASTAWLRPLLVPDEGRYVGVAWEMLRSGDWLVPTLNGLPYFHKPPLFYWITSASLHLFGLHEWAARAAPLAGAFMAACALYLFARRWSGESTARLALLALATQPMFFMGAQFANLDMLVAGCIGATILAAAHAAMTAQQGRLSRRALAAAWLFAALGLLAKGLIGIVLPGMVVLAWLLVERRLALVRQLLWLPAIAIFFGVAAPWFIAMQMRFPEFGHYFFVVQHFQRFAGSGFNNAQPFWFFPVVIALLTLPWAAWLAAAAARRYWCDPQHGPIRKLMWLWLALVTLFFSLPQSKLVGYVLPITVPVAFLVGDSARSLWSDSVRVPRLWTICAGVAIATCLAAVVLAATHPGKSLRGLAQTLASRAAPGEPVVFLHDYFFDVEFYAQLRAPVRVVEDWEDPAVMQRDNWTKELRDAQRFAAPGGVPVLLAPSQLADIIDNSSNTWVLGFRGQKIAGPAGVFEVARSNETVLWRVPGKGRAGINAAGSPEKPSANSTGK